MKNVKSGHSQPIVCLDAGHYGKYNRSPAVKSYYESDMAWTLHLLLKAELESYGIKVTTTRTNKDKDLGLKARGKASKGSDLFLSLHSNAVGSGVNESIDYVAVYHLYEDAGTKIDDQSKDLAKLLAPVISKTMGVKQSPNISTRRGSGDHNDDGVLNDNYYSVLNGARLVGTPALILEHSFHTNTKATKWLLEESNLKKLAVVEAEIIANWFDVKKSAGSTTSAKTYKVITPINRYTSSADAVAQKNAKADKLAVGTYYIYNKYPTGVNGVYNISTDKTGSSAGSWINPKENVVATNATSTEKLYRVRKSKDDAASQKGAFTSLDNAKECCQSAGAGYYVFDWNWKAVYSYTAPVAAKATLSSIAITKAPTKTTYTVGEGFDSTGLIVTATYSDKSTKTITNYSISGFTTTKAATITVTVTYEKKTATFNVTVKEKTPVAKPEKAVAVYDLDYPQKVKIVDRSIDRTKSDCTKAIKKILANNNAFDVDIAKSFFRLAPKYGIDPMMAISQSILETGWFKYAGSAVTANQHNYCGLGVTSNGVKGASFETIDDGVTAQLQHLFAYGCKEALPAGDKVLDPRFNLVTRGIAQYWQQLAGRWAVPGFDGDSPEKAMVNGTTYGQKIIKIFDQLVAVTITGQDIDKYFPTQVDTEPEKPVEKLPDVAQDDLRETDTSEKDISTPEIIEPSVPDEGQLDETNDEKVESIVDIIIRVLKRLAEIFLKGFKSKGE